MQRKAYLLLGLGLVGFHVSVYGILPALGLSRQEVLAQVGLLPADFWNFSQPLALFTSPFLFKDWAGVLSSVFLLYSLLRFLDWEMGGLRFLSLFCISGVLGGVPLLWLWPDSYNIYGTASAGIFGLLAILSVFYPKGKVRFLFWEGPFAALLVFGWGIALLFLLPWESIGNEGSSAGAWSIPILGALFALLYARLALALPIGGRLSFEPGLWYLAVEHPKRHREGDCFKELQELGKAQEAPGQIQAKDSGAIQAEGSGFRQAAKKESRDRRASPAFQPSSAKNPVRQNGPPAHKRLIYDPESGRFILKEGP